MFSNLNRSDFLDFGLEGLPEREYIAIFGLDIVYVRYQDRPGYLRIIGLMKSNSMIRTELSVPCACVTLRLKLR